MKTIARHSQSLFSHRNIESFVEMSSRIGGIAIFVMAVAAVGYFLATN